MEPSWKPGPEFTLVATGFPTVKHNQAAHGLFQAGSVLETQPGGPIYSPWELCRNQEVLGLPANQHGLWRPELKSGQ